MNPGHDNDSVDNKKIRFRGDAEKLYQLWVQEVMAVRFKYESGPCIMQFRNTG